jgi:hypothetical protein
MMSETSESFKYKVVNKAGGSCFVLPHSEFYLDYKKGNHVKAKKGTLGIMVFPTRHQASAFQTAHEDRFNNHIKKVIPMGKVTFPDSVAMWPKSDADLKAFNKMGPRQRRYDRHCIV